MVLALFGFQEMVNPRQAGWEINEGMEVEDGAPLVVA